MEFCSICTTSFDAGDRRIRCSGQSCSLLFHQRCVHLSEDHVRSWLEGDVGWFWFCPTCRVDLKENVEGEPPAAKRSRMDPSPRLPPEVWTMIFGHLKSRWLARVRLVCRDWNELVTTRSELMDRFLLKLGKYQVVDNLAELRYFLALGRGFTRAEFNFYELRKGQAQDRLLLRVMPNLKRLTLDGCFEYGKLAKLNYQLTKLEELFIFSFFNKKHGHGGSIFPTLQHICPRIKVLNISLGEYDNFYQDIGRFVFAVRNTLQDLDTAHAFKAGKVMDALVTMDGLRLKRINIDCSERDLVRLLRRQPALESLWFHGVVTDASTLDEIASILPNLKQIILERITLEQATPSKRLNFPRAEDIKVCYVGSSDCVSGLAYCQSSYLQRLEISVAYLPSDALADLSQIATQSVSFVDCTVERSSDIYSFIQQSKSLCTFVIKRIGVKTVYDMPNAAFGPSCIRYLTFFENSRELLHAFVEICPGLETVDVEHDLVEDDLHKMGQRLQRLKSLTLNGCNGYVKAMSVECLRQIPSGFNELKKLQINTWGVPKETILEALQGLRKDVEVSISYW
ncbi:hypothetical protein pipiens_015759 [Culex pipiens pipiens]|uniref:F-box domain-containing protein n=1 Tax=Culex pipiens pipiens TaxID=38569 RepID=A0ABD1CP41_CULPP